MLVRGRGRGLAAAALASGAVLGACSSGTAGTTTTRPASFATLIGAGSRLLAEGNTNAATQLFDQAIAENPRSPVGYYDVGVIEQRRGETTAALGDYRLALRHDGDYVPALYNEAVIVSPSDAPLAMSDYRRAISLQPDSPTAQLNLGLLEEAQGEQPQALANLYQAVRLRPELVDRIPPALRRLLSRYRPGDSATGSG